MPRPIDHLVGTLVVACSLPAMLAAQPAEPLRVVASNGVKAVIESLEPELERAAGRPLDIEFSTAASLKTRIESGESFDVAILTPSLIDDLVEQAKVAAAARRNFGRVGVGVGARAGSRFHDVGTVDALKRTLLEAQSIAYTADGQSRATIDRAFERLGIATEMQAKSILKGPGQAPAAVAAGEAELVLTLVSEILPVPGLVLVGPLPEAVQGYIGFAASRSAQTRLGPSANAFLEYLGTDQAREALVAHGMEPYRD